MKAKHKHDNPILVTGAAGAVGGIGRNLTEFLLAKGLKVRALVRREDKRAEAPRRLGAEIVGGDLTDLASMHRAIEGCGRFYFGMSVSAAYVGGSGRRFCSMRPILRPTAPSNIAVCSIKGKSLNLTEPMSSNLH